MKIPYGISDFRQIRAEGFFYADKTPFLPVLERPEAGYRHLLFLRPRRFGKSTLLSMLEHYYDLAKRDQFDELFNGLWVHEHPTPERHRYMVLTLDFSGVSVDGGQASIERSFFDTVKESVVDWAFAYRERFPAVDWLSRRIDGYESPEALMGGVLNAVRRVEHKLYVLIDEYDHFANRLLSGAEAPLYDKVIAERTGFVRTFYAKLKAGTRGGIARMFMTGVSPIMMDDLSSGFNIASHVSQDPAFNTMAGLTRADVTRAVSEVLGAGSKAQAALGAFTAEGLIDVLERYYNGYRFSPDAGERVFNADMVLYFLAQIARRGRYPDDMLDLNVRTDYRHLRRIGAPARAKERRALLEVILSQGHIRCDLVQQFGVKSLSGRAPYLSLLYYLGMLTLGPSPRDAEGYDLEVPNRVIHELQWEHLALTLADETPIDVSSEDLNAALGAMGAGGAIQPFLDLFHARVLKKLGVKDTRGLGERHLKLMLMTYLSQSRMFHVLSEKELAQGYCDLFLGPHVNAPGARYSWLLELKYLPAGAKRAHIEAAFVAAEAQIARYMSDEDLLSLLARGGEVKAGSIVFVGLKQVMYRPWAGGEGED